MTEPVIKNCPSSDKIHYVLKYGTLTLDPPLEFFDNSGAVKSVKWSYDMRRPISEDITITVNATDYSGNVAVCQIFVMVRGRMVVLFQGVSNEHSSKFLHFYCLTPF